MRKFRVDLVVTVDVEANDETHAEVVALESWDIPGASVTEVIELCNEKQPELF